MSDVQPLPPGELLLHIGPFKTGTTTVQAAFHQNREALARQRIHYAGRGSQPMAAAMEAAGRETLPTLGRGPDRWSRLLEEIRAADARHVVVSSEFFSGADDDRARSIVEALGADRTHVVVTLRPLVRILASQWQQYIQNRIVVGYDEWLHAVLDDPDAPPRVTPSFWLRHRHDRLVRRWAQAVGTDRLTVVVVDESDQRMLPRTFEQLLGLEPETLVAHDLGSNRSLSWPEVELVRAFNRGWIDEDWSMADYTRLLRFGAIRRLQERKPPEAETRVPIPAWAVARATGIGADMVAGIRSSGVRVIGDLDTLADPALAPNVADVPERPGIPVGVAAGLLAGVVAELAAVPAGPPPGQRVVGPLEAEMRRRHEVSAPPQGRAGGVRHLLGRVRGRLARGVRRGSGPVR
jgi:hypothetical protein